MYDLTTLQIINSRALDIEAKQRTDPAVIREMTDNIRRSAVLFGITALTALEAFDEVPQATIDRNANPVTCYSYLPVVPGGN